MKCEWKPDSPPVATDCCEGDLKAEGQYVFCQRHLAAMWNAIHQVIKLESEIYQKG